MHVFHGHLDDRCSGAAQSVVQGSDSNSVVASDKEYSIVVHVPCLGTATLMPGSSCILKLNTSTDILFQVDCMDSLKSTPKGMSCWKVALTRRADRGQASL